MSEVRISEKAQWKRPFTVKRYIHPPMSEEVVMMWPDGKIMFEGVDSERYPWEYEASAFKILIGEDNEEIDFKKIKYETRQDGVPVHAFRYLKDGTELRMESFCTVERSPVSYSRLTFRNKTEEEIRGKYSFILRTGIMVLLMGVEQDGYAHLNTNLGNWGFIPTEFQYENGRVYDKAVTMELFGAEDCALTWVGNVAGIPWRYRGVLQAEIVLPPRGEKDLYIAFYRTGKEPAERDYEKEKKKTVKFWEEELSKIRVYPKTRGKRNDGMYRTLVANSLQMFAYPKGKDYVIPRQGGNAEQYLAGGSRIYVKGVGQDRGIFGIYGKSNRILSGKVVYIGGERERRFQDNVRLDRLGKRYGCNIGNDRMAYILRNKERL